MGTLPARHLLSSAFNHALDEEFEKFIRHAKQLPSPDVFGKVEGWLWGSKDDIDLILCYMRFFRYLGETPGGDEEWCETTTVDYVENNVTCWVIENIEDEDE